MRVSKRHVFTFSVLSLVQLNSSTLNAGQISNLIERTAAGEVGNVRSAMTRKIDIQTLHQSQVQNWIEGIQSLRHTRPDLKVGDQPLTDVLKVLEDLKGYLVQKVELGKREIKDIDAWSTSQGVQVDGATLKSRYLELRSSREKYTQSFAEDLQKKTINWARLLKHEYFAHVIELITAPVRQALQLADKYEETHHGAEYDALAKKEGNSKKPGGTPLSPEDRTRYNFLHSRFNVEGPEEMIKRVNQAYSPQELIKYLTIKAASYAVKSILAPVTLPDPAGPNCPAGAEMASDQERKEDQTATSASPVQLPEAPASSSSGAASNSGKKGGGGGRRK